MDGDRPNLVENIDPFFFLILHHERMLDAEGNYLLLAGEVSGKAKATHIRGDICSVNASSIAKTVGEVDVRIAAA